VRSVLGRPRGRFGIRLGDVGMTVVVLVAVELSVITGNGPGAAKLDAKAYLLGAVLVLPVLLRNRYPRFELLACSVLLLLYYTFDRDQHHDGHPHVAQPDAEPAAGPAEHAAHGHPVHGVTLRDPGPARNYAA